MKEIVFATHNPHKIRELQEMIGDKYKILSLTDIGCNEDIPENEPTVEGNAMYKAKYVFENYNVGCFADDTGLFIEALNGAPGVYSARYAGEHKNSNDNVDLVLNKLKNLENRNAYFCTVIAYKTENEEKYFEGIIRGVLTEKRFGEGGFGYDPIFKPLQSNLTFAEMNPMEKNKISHRGLAVQKFIEYINL